MSTPQQAPAPHPLDWLDEVRITLLEACEALQGIVEPFDHLQQTTPDDRDLVYVSQLGSMVGIIGTALDDLREQIQDRVTDQRHHLKAAA